MGNSTGFKLKLSVSNSHKSFVVISDLLNVNIAFRIDKRLHGEIVVDAGEHGEQLLKVHQTVHA